MTQQQTLLSWLTDAHAMEVGAVRTLEQHGEAAKDYPEMRARLHEHAQETRRHAEKVENCIERLGSRPSTIKEALGTVMGTVQGAASLPAQDMVVKNALADYASENFEIACYTSLIAAAERLFDSETARVCREILAEEEEMAEWLEKQISPVTQQFLATEAAKPDGSTRSSAVKRVQGAAQGMGEQGKELLEGAKHKALTITGVLVASVGAGLLLTQALKGSSSTERRARGYPSRDRIRYGEGGRESGRGESRVSRYVEPSGQMGGPRGQETGEAWSYTEVWLVPGPYSGVGPRGYQTSGDPTANEVTSRLTQHGQVDASDIEIIVEENGRVTLRGTVASEETKRLAEEAVEGVLGVSELRNDLQVRAEGEI